MVIRNIRLIDWLFIVKRPIWEYFTHMETSPLSVKGCIFRPGLGAHDFWARKDLYRATPAVTRGLGRLFRSHPKKPLHSIASYNKQGILRTYSNPDPQATRWSRFEYNSTCLKSLVTLNGGCPYGETEKKPRFRVTAGANNKYSSLFKDRDHQV